MASKHYSVLKQKAKRCKSLKKLKIFWEELNGAKKIVEELQPR